MLLKCLTSMTGPQGAVQNNTVPNTTARGRNILSIQKISKNKNHKNGPANNNKFLNFFLTAHSPVRPPREQPVRYRAITLQSIPRQPVRYLWKQESLLCAQTQPLPPAQQDQGPSYLNPNGRVHLHSAPWPLRSLSTNVAVRLIEYSLRIKVTHFLSDLVLVLRVQSCSEICLCCSGKITCWLLCAKN